MDTNWIAAKEREVDFIVPEDFSPERSKFCPVCNKELSLDSFAMNSSKADGLQTECKKCASRYKAMNYEKSKLLSGKKREVKI